MPIDEWVRERNKARGQAADALRYQAQADTQAAAKRAGEDITQSLPGLSASTPQAIARWAAEIAGQRYQTQATSIGPRYTPPAPIPVASPAPVPAAAPAEARPAFVPHSAINYSDSPAGRAITRYRQLVSKTLTNAIMYGPTAGGYETYLESQGKATAPQTPSPERTAYITTQGVLSGATLGAVPATEKPQTTAEQVGQTIGNLAGSALPWEGAFRLVGAPAAAAASPVGEAVGNAAARLAARLGAREGVQQGTQALAGFLTREAARGAAAGGAIGTASLATEPVKTPGEAINRVGGTALSAAGFSAGMPLVGEAVSRFGIKPISRIIGDARRTFVPTGEAVPVDLNMDLGTEGYRFMPGKNNQPGLWVKQDPTTGLHYAVQVEKRVSPEGNVQTWMQTFQEAPKGAKVAPKAPEVGPVIDVTPEPVREPAAATAQPEPAPATEPAALPAPAEPVGTPAPATAEAPSPSPVVPAEAPAEGPGALPAVTDNYVKPLSSYAPVVYREGNLASTAAFIPRFESVDTTPDTPYFANTPNLALGQGENKGILAEFDAAPIQGQVNTQKPAWQAAWNQGEGEFIAKLNHQDVYQQALRRISIRPDATMDKVDRKRLKLTLASLEQAGWAKQTWPNGIVTYTRPGVESLGQLPEGFAAGLPDKVAPAAEAPAKPAEVAPAVAPVPAAEPAPGPASNKALPTYAENAAKDGVELKFPSKPTDETILALRANGFKWQRQDKVWFAPRTAESRAFAQRLAGIETPAQETTAQAAPAQVLSRARQTSAPSQGMQVSWEATPGKSTGFLPGIHEATPEQRAAYLNAILKALTDEDGMDAVAKAIGLPVEKRTVLPGYWDGSSEPSVQVEISLPEGGAESVKPLAEAYANVIGGLLRQEAVGWHIPRPVTDINAANAVEISLGRPLTVDETKGLGDILRSRGGDGFALLNNPNGVRVLYFGDKPIGDFKAETVEALSLVFPEPGTRVEVGLLRADSGLIENDWRAKPNGDDYRQRLAAAGRSDLQDYVDLHLAPRVDAVNRDFANRYGWDRPADGASEPGGSPAGPVTPLTTTATPEVSRPSAQRQGGGAVSEAAATAEGVPAKSSNGGGTQSFAAAARPAKPNLEGPAPLQPMDRKALINWLGKKFDVTLAKGHFNQRAFGIYKVGPEVIRTKAWGDLQTLGHEIGHHLDKKLELGALGHGDELLTLGKKAVRGDATKAKLRTEGIAEFIRLYLGDPATARAKAPGFYAAFEKRLESEPELGKVIADAQAQFMAHFKATADQEIDAAVSWNNKKAPIGERIGKPSEAVQRAANWIVDEWFDSNDAVRRAQRVIAGKGELPPNLDAYKKLSVLPRLIPGRVEAKLQEWQDIMKPLGKNVEDYLRYADAKAVLWRANQFGYENEKLPFSREAAEAKVSQVEDGPNAGLYKETFAKEQQLFHDALQMLVDAEVLNAEAVAKIEGAHHAYVPLFRDVESGRVKGGGGGGGRTTVNLSKGVMRQHGGSEPLMDPIERRVRYFSRVTGIAERNKIGVTLDNFAEAYEGSGKLWDKVPAPLEMVKVKNEFILDALEEAGVDTSELDPTDTISFFRPKWANGKKDTIITIYRGGKPEYRDLHDPAVFRAIADVDPAVNDLVGKILDKTTQLVKTGATISPAWTIANLLRDTFESFALSGRQMLPFHALAEAIIAATTKDPIVERMVKDGLKQGGWINPGKQSVQMLRSIARGKKYSLSWRGLWNLYQATRENPEFWTRLGEARLEFRAAKRSGYTDEEAYLAGLYEGNRGSLNFFRGGYTARRVNRKVPFFKIPFEAAYRQVEAAREHPLVWLLKLAGFAATGVAMVAWAKDNKEYQEATPYERDNYWLIPLGPKVLFRVPKPNGLPAVVVDTFERAARQVLQDDPHAWDEFAKDVAGQVMPRVSIPILDFIVGIATNQSLSSDFPIVPESEQNLPKPDQYGPDTSWLMKKVGQKGPLSPRQWQFGVETMVPGFSLGYFLTEDAVRRGAHLVLGDKAGVAPASARPEDLPAVGRFISRPGEGKQGYSVTVFYNEKDKADTLHAGLQKQASEASGIPWPDNGSWSYEAGKGVTLKAAKMDAGQRQKLQDALAAELAKLKQDNPDDFRIVSHRSDYAKWAKQLSDLRSKRREAEESKTLTPQQKRQAIDAYNRQATNLAEQALGKSFTGK